MIRINLLPYREQRRKAQLRRDGIGAGIFLVIVAGLLVATYLHLQGVESRHKARVEYMKTALSKIRDQLDEVDKLKEKRADLVKKLGVIKDLQEGRDRSVRLFETLGRAVPEEVSLQSVRQQDSGLQLEGEARSNSDISSFMRRLEASDLFADPDLEVITNSNRNGNPVKTFKMGVRMADAAQGSGEKDGDSGKGG
ncbi:PilN domain-containing protein [Thiohalorhabdus sp. Cl-TMA]|uniref:PilN domain-containing protein n=1 Tax=Thiohalorhabdus methylotrophus TaxID=3242694 RepID=A0ABV4TRX7_9GAMM